MGRNTTASWGRPRYVSGAPSSWLGPEATPGSHIGTPFRAAMTNSKRTLLKRVRILFNLPSTRVLDSP